MADENHRAVTLERGDFFELLAAAQAVELKLKELAEQVAPLEQRKRALVEALAKQYGFDGQARWTFDIATHTLTRAEE